jgi:hypothetical protein
MKNGSGNFLGKGGGEGSKILIINSTNLSNPMQLIVLIGKTYICQYGVSPIKLARVTKVHILMQDLLK